MWSNTLCFWEPNLYLFRRPLCRQFTISRSPPFTWLWFCFVLLLFLFSLSSFSLSMFLVDKIYQKHYLSSVQLSLGLVSFHNFKHHIQRNWKRSWELRFSISTLSFLWRLLNILFYDLSLLGFRLGFIWRMFLVQVSS